MNFSKLKKDQIHKIQVPLQVAPTAKVRGHVIDMESYNTDMGTYGFEFF